MAAFVLSILGWFVCPILAWIGYGLAGQAITRIELSSGALSGLELARAARIIGGINLLMAAAGVVLFLMLVLFSVASRSSG